MAMDLVVDCSRKGVNLGLYAGDAVYELLTPEAKGDELNSLIDKLLSENNFELSQIERVLVTLGPGSFTGIRTGIAFCEGLCFSGKRTLHGVSTLRALAAHLPNGTTALDFPKNGEIILHARADFYYTGNADGETLQQFKTKPQTHENLAITPFAKLIPLIKPNRIQKANYLVNPYS
jgi:tRNA threonylcarbamoyladenosine biosynthesis protein TsaB